MLSRILRSPFALLCAAACAVLLTGPTGANSEVGGCCTGCLECGSSCTCPARSCTCSPTPYCTVGVRAAAGPAKEKAELERMSEGGGSSGTNLWFHPVGPWLDFGR